MLQILVVLGLISSAWYLLIVRPQRDRHIRHSAVVSQLAPGVHVMTVGGIYGRVTSIDGTTVVIEIAPGMETRVAVDGVARIAQGAEAQLPVQEQVPSQESNMHHDHQHPHQHPHQQHHFDAAPAAPAQHHAFPAPQVSSLNTPAFVPNVTLRASAPPAPVQPGMQQSAAPHISELGPSSYRVEAAPSATPLRPPVWAPRPWSAASLDAPLEVSTRTTEPAYTPIARPDLPASPVSYQPPAHNAFGHQPSPYSPQAAPVPPPAQQFYGGAPVNTSPSPYAAPQPYAPQQSYAAPQQYAPQQPYAAPQQYAPQQQYYPVPQPHTAPQHYVVPQPYGAAPGVPVGHAMQVQPIIEEEAPRKHSRAPEGMGSSVRMSDPKLREQTERARREREELAEEYERLLAPYVAAEAAPAPHQHVYVQPAPGQLFAQPNVQAAVAPGHVFPAPAIVPTAYGHAAPVPHPAEAAFDTAAFQRAAPYSSQSAS